MPELPEVERVRRSLVDHVIGRRIVGVELRREDVVEFDKPEPRSARAKRAALLEGRSITAIDRRGKQLAIVSDDEKSPVLCIHLGMTGSLTCQSAAPLPADSKHTHVVWHLDNGRTVSFHDPRRFGGIWCFENMEGLVARRWKKLGDDALTISPDVLHGRLRVTKRGLKAALLDQSLVAGLGNIYVDELLFSCGLHPLEPACRIGPDVVTGLVQAIRDLLERAIASGGSTLRNYVDANGKVGSFQFAHRVYGRGGQPCECCRATLVGRMIAGRTTVYCKTCQGRRSRRLPTTRRRLARRVERRTCGP